MNAFSFPRFVLLIGTICSVVAMQASVHAQDQTVNGNMGVAGEMDVYGNTLNFGSWATDATKFGLGIKYSEDSSHASTLTLTTTRSVSGWLWQRAPTSGTVNLPQMRLSSGNALTLYDQTSPTPVAKIVLDPLGTSTFGTSAIFNGANNLMPNQTVTGNTSVLTVGLADARYMVTNNGYSLTIGNGAVASSPWALAVGYQTQATGTNSTAVGNQANAHGNNASAYGLQANASGENATAIGFGDTASGSNSTAVGMQATASASQSAAFGVGSNATGVGSIAVGLWTTASGSGAMTFGTSTLASGEGSMALGQLSQATNAYAAALGYVSKASGYMSTALGEGSLASNYYTTTLGGNSAATGWATESLGYHSAADGTAAVAVGNYSHASGNESTALASSSVASGDYSVAAGRTEATSLYQFAVGAYGLSGGNAHTWVATDDLFTVANGQSAAAPSNAFSIKKNGDTTVNGNLNVVKAIIVQPQGDLLMGEFMAQPSPAP